MGLMLYFWAGQKTDSTNLDIFGQLFDANGNPIGGEFEVSQDTGDVIDTVSFNSFATTTPDGGYMVTWESTQTTDLDIYTRKIGVTSDGPDLTASQIEMDLTNNQKKPGIHHLTDDKYVLTWSDTSSGEKIFAQVIQEDGTALGSPVPVAATAPNEVPGDLIVLSDGTIAISFL